MGDQDQFEAFDYTAVAQLTPRAMAMSKEELVAEIEAACDEALGPTETPFYRVIDHPELRPGGEWNTRPFQTKAPD